MKWKVVKNEIVLISMLLMSGNVFYLYKNMHKYDQHHLYRWWVTEVQKWNLFVRVTEHMIWLVRFVYAMLWLSWYMYYAVKLMFDRIKEGINTNKLDIILLGSAVLQMIKHWNIYQFVIKWKCIDHGISYLFFHRLFIKRKKVLSYWLVVIDGTWKHCIWSFKMETFVSYLQFTFVMENRCKVELFL